MRDPVRDKSFQQQFPRNACYGCGHDHASGLHVQSHWIDEGTAACEFIPQPEHCAASPKFVNGGIIATVVDCHAIATAIANAYMREGRMIGEGEELIYVTGSLKVDYTAPAAIDQALVVQARVTNTLGKKSIVSCDVFSGKQPCGRAQVVCIKVDPDEWFGTPRCSHGK